MKPAKSGRPKLDKKTVRGCTLIMRLSKSERAIINMLARGDGMKPSAWVRKVIMETIDLMLENV